MSYVFWTLLGVAALLLLVQVVKSAMKKNREAAAILAETKPNNETATAATAVEAKKPWWKKTGSGLRAFGRFLLASPGKVAFLAIAAFFILHVFLFALGMVYAIATPSKASPLIVETENQKSASPSLPPVVPDKMKRLPLIVTSSKELTLPSDDEKGLWQWHIDIPDSSVVIAVRTYNLMDSKPVQTGIWYIGGAGTHQQYPKCDLLTMQTTNTVATEIILTRP